MFSLRGKVAVVTGGVGLLGRQHALALASQGASVVVADVDGDAAARTAREVEERHGAAALGLAVDVTSRRSLEDALGRVLGALDRLDVLVNNAGISDHAAVRAESGRFESYPEERWDEVFAVNVKGVFLSCQVFGAELARRRGGSIINIASTYGVVAPDQSLYRRPDGSQSFYKSAAYPASKGAVLALTRYLAAYWGAAGVRVNALSPGGVANGQERHFIEQYGQRTPLGRMAEPDDYRGAIVFLASDESRYMTGANLLVDGGWCAW